MAKTAGELETRVRNWLSARNREKLPPVEIYGLMNEAANELVKLFDVWFCKVWGSVVRDEDNAVWATRSILPPLAEDGSPLTASQIAAGAVPQNTPYLRAVPYPEGLYRPYKAYWNEIQKGNELAFLLEDEFETEYDFQASGGTPAAYSVTGDSVLLGPTPGFDVTLWVQGYYEPVQLEDEESENEFTRHGHELLVYATQNMIIKYNYEEEERADLFRAEYSRALRAALAQGGRTTDVARQSVLQRKG